MKFKDFYYISFNYFLLVQDKDENILIGERETDLTWFEIIENCEVDDISFYAEDGEVHAVVTIKTTDDVMRVYNNYARKMCHDYFICPIDDTTCYYYDSERHRCDMAAMGHGYPENECEDYQAHMEDE